MERGQHRLVNLFIGGTYHRGPPTPRCWPSLSPSGFALTDGYAIKCTAGFTNTTAMTLAVTSPSISATPVVMWPVSILLLGGEIYDGG